MFVAYPRTVDELRDAVKPFERAGFPGMCALTDRVHVRYSGYNAGSRFKFVGGKKYPTVCWNVSVDYNGQPIYVSHVAPGATNDKLLASNYDEFLRDVVRKDPVYTGFEYNMASRRGVQMTRGVTIGVDGGYQNHREFIAPFEWPSSSVRLMAVDIGQGFGVSPQEGGVFLWYPEEAVSCFGSPCDAH